MKKIKAHYNWARWIVFCPDCALEGKTMAAEVTDDNVFVCPEEYPDILAKTLLPNPRMAGAFNSVPDIILREETKEKAIAEGNAYQVEMPAKKIKTEIERILRARPREGRNWQPGVPLEDMIEENKERGV